MGQHCLYVKADFFFFFNKTGRFLVKNTGRFELTIEDLGPLYYKADFRLSFIKNYKS